MKHTPGEWAVNSDQPEKLIVYAKNSGQIIALCSNFNKIIYPKKDAEANAKLIASAPSMLEELERTYLQLQIIVQRGFKEGRATFAVATDGIRANLRNQISAFTGRDCQEIQDECEAKALAAINKATN